MIAFDIITIFPRIFDSYFKESLIGRAQDKGLIKIRIHNLRDFTSDKHKTVDDMPYGGGPGMIFKVEPIYKAVQKIKKKKSGKTKVVLFSAKGKKLTQDKIKAFAKLDQLILICGRFEGVDERVARHIADEEISIGSFVLAGGEIPAMAVTEAVSRCIPGVIGKKESLKEESFNAPDKKLEYPQYTRPENFQGFRVPKVLLSGDHGKIKEWRERHKK